ncbi:hypothetical protein HYS72_02570 [Candidatus Pacearchaeota archaeon]|nr:hypothetical protein [Candidatus Pacearchaeota archaeon]MBI2056661.1 hypothetical protein [Candidatus Pacearchaeota archaeon]
MTNKNNENNTWIIAIIAIAILFFLFSGAGMMGYGGMMGGTNYGFSGMWIFGFLFMVLILVALVLFIVWLIKQLQNPRRKY